MSNIEPMNIAEMVADARNLLARIENALFAMGAAAEQAVVAHEESCENETDMVLEALENVTANCVVRDAGNSLFSGEAHP